MLTSKATKLNLRRCPSSGMLTQRAVALIHSATEINAFRSCPVIAGVLISEVSAVVRLRGYIPMNRVPLL